MKSSVDLESSFFGSREIPAGYLANFKSSKRKFKQPIWSFCFISGDSPPLKLCNIVYVQNRSDEKSNEPEILGLGRPFILGCFDDIFRTEKKNLKVSHRSVRVCAPM